MLNAPEILLVVVLHGLVRAQGQREDALGHGEPSGALEETVAQRAEVLELPERRATRRADAWVRGGGGAGRERSAGGYTMSRFTFSLMAAMVAPLLGMIACSGPTLGGGAGSTTGTGGKSACPAPDPTPPDMPAQCAVPTEDQCMRYHIPLDGNPSTDVALRNKYIAAFGTACYMSVVDTFDCFYKTWQAACADAVKIAEVYGAAPFDKGYTCQPVLGTDDYTLQVGPDVANKITINYQAAPRQTPLVEIDGVPTEVNGPYRNLTEPPTLGPGQPFNKCDSGMVAADGGALTQTKYILQVNRKKYGGEIHSDLAGFKWLCERKDENCKVVVEECEELLILHDRDDDKAPFDPGAIAEVHHVVPMNDKRSCSWGTNSNKNAAVISAKLNKFFTNNNPPEEEVKKLNNATAYTP
jgi:hypothetical protein